MIEEIPQEIIGYLTKKGVSIEDEKTIEELKIKGYGEENDKKFMLKDYEAIFLLYTNMIKVLEEDKEISLNNLVDFALLRDSNAWTRFLIFRDLRSRGYVVREGFGFGSDFRVYDRGDYGSRPAKYVVCGLNEGTKMTIKELNDNVNQIKKMGKETVIAVLERRGEAIYYKIRVWMPYMDE